MQKLTIQSIEPYLENIIFPKLNFSDPKIQKIERAEGGISSLVFKARINGKNFYVKQVLKGRLNGLEKSPRDLDVLFSLDRQKYEIKAISLFNEAVGPGLAPDIIYFDRKMKVLILNDVAKTGSMLFENEFEKLVNKNITIQLAQIAANLASETYEKYNFLRGEKKDLDVKKVKLKYTYGALFKNLSEDRNKINKLVKGFINKSVNCSKSLCHGDYHPKNIIIKNGKKVALIDFEEAVIHDPVWDISSLAAHYLLRALNDSKKKKEIKKMSILLIDKFFEKLEIPKKRKDLEFRINNYMAGWMMMRVDGYSKAKWIKNEKVKKNIRKNSLDLITSDISTVKFIDCL